MGIIIYGEIYFHISIFVFFHFGAISVWTFVKDSLVKKKKKKSPIPPSHKHWVAAIKAGDHHVLQPAPGFIIFQWPRRTFALIWLIFPRSCHWLCWLYLKDTKSTGRCLLSTGCLGRGRRGGRKGGDGGGQRAQKRGSVASSRDAG